MNPRNVPTVMRRVLSDWRNRLFIEHDLRRATPVIVYQMGKVGSSSVYRSLREQYPGVVLHTHGFSAKNRDPRVRRVYRWAIDEALPLNVVSPVREPVARNVSAFFENFERDTGVSYADSRFTVDELRTLFLTKYNHEIPLEWFDECILAKFGIDVFATPFPASGFCCYSRNNIRLLVVRCETEDAAKAGAIGDFLGIPAFRITNANIGEDKDYAPAYRAFKSSVALPPEYVEKMCGSKYFNHFYPKETIDATRQKWSRQ
jgi:hypothetical protein